jgi:hypothetical protein
MQAAADTGSSRHHRHLGAHVKKVTGLIWRQYLLSYRQRLSLPCCMCLLRLTNIPSKQTQQGRDSLCATTTRRAPQCSHMLPPGDTWQH